MEVCGHSLSLAKVPGGQRTLEFPDHVQAQALGTRADLHRGRGGTDTVGCKLREHGRAAEHVRPKAALPA